MSPEELRSLRDDLRELRAFVASIRRRINRLDVPQPPRREPVRAEGNVVPFAPLSAAATMQSA